MNTLEIFLTGFSLAMDAFMICICKNTRNKKDGIKMIIIFSLFQTIMPIIGYYLGNEFSKRIINYSPILSAILLITIGILLFKEENDNTNISLKTVEILLLGISTSIDAFIIGISFSFLQNNIYTSSIIIGIITCIICTIGVFFGNYLNKKLSHYSNKIGGITLIIIGIRTLIQHLS